MPKRITPAPFEGTAEEAACLYLLNGYLEPDARGLSRRRYVCGKNERDALLVLARLIEDDRLTPRLRYSLAALVDPSGNSERKIAFQFRRSGNRSSHEGDFDIQTTFIDARKTGKSVSGAVEAVAEKFDLDKSTVEKALRRYGRRFSNYLVEVAAIRTK
jgi:hypothetical protein